MVLSSCLNATTPFCFLLLVLETCLVSNTRSKSAKSSKGLWTGPGKFGSTFPGNPVAKRHRRAKVVERIREDTIQKKNERIMKYGMIKEKDGV